jgi:mRNA interferase MazF
MEASQYQIVLVNPDNKPGSETRKTGQCIVISPDEMNKFLRTVIIAPVSSDTGSYPTRIKIRYANKTFRVVLDQIMTIEKQSIIKVLGELSAPEIKKIKSALKETFVD